MGHLGNHRFVISNNYLLCHAIRGKSYGLGRRFVISKGDNGSS